MGESRHPLRTPIVVRNCYPMLFVTVDGTGHLILEAFYGSDQVYIDAIQPHGCPQSCVPNSVERLFEVCENVVKVLLVLHVFPTEYSKVGKLLCCDSSCSETCLFFFDYLLSLWLQFILEDF